ncbi:MAG TPA: c-type cytochrome [Chloroflexia bacterium]|nr:c-type cytochrome [Chloroflexia bacterium]
MRDKVILGTTLTVVLLLTLLVYAAVDFQRTPIAQASARDEAITAGKKVFAVYCVQCHGPKGEGCIGPALNRVTWRAEIDGVANPAFDPDSHDLIYKTVERGRASNQPDEQMPAWSTTEGGSLNNQDIEHLITFIQYGNWDQVLENAASAVGQDKDLPDYSAKGFNNGQNDPAKLAQVKSTMLAKGCLNCHTVGAVGGKIGADLTDVGSRRTADWLRRWIKDPSQMPAAERGPNLWIAVPKPSLDTPGPNSAPTATPQAFPMNATFMPTIKMTDDELSLLVDYLSHAKTGK